MMMRWNGAVRRGKMGTSNGVPGPPIPDDGALIVFNDASKEATEMGFMSIVVGVLLFLIPAACLYVGYMTDSGKM